MSRFFISTIGALSLTISVQAQGNSTHYKVPVLKITLSDKPFSDGMVDFGYNVTESKTNKFIQNGYYIWIEDQWFFVKNAKEIFAQNISTPLLFTLKNTAQKLQIIDANGKGYSYPIDAIAGYSISEKDFTTWASNSKFLTVEKQYVEELTSVAAKPILDIVEVTEVAKSQTKSIDATKSNEVVKSISIKNEDSPILDVEEIVEVTRKVVINTDGTAVESESNPKEEKKSNEKTIAEEKPIVKNSEIKIGKEEKILSRKTSNDYEKAVNEGFDGTVSEWIQSVDAKGGKTAYQQAVEAGFKGTEQEWKRSLWGTTVSPEEDSQEKTNLIVSKWMQELNSEAGYSPYEIALKNGFYGTFTEWVESVVGKDGEKVYQEEVKSGYKGTYKEWIESKLNASNEEMQRKAFLRKANFVLVPNLQLNVPEDKEKEEVFDLYQYYLQYYGGSVVSSNKNQVKNIEIRRTDLEYQITWYNAEDIKIIDLSDKGELRYSAVNNKVKNTSINVRFVVKNN